MENITKTPLLSVSLLNRKNLLVRSRRMFLALSTLALIGSVIDFVTKGFSVGSLFVFSLSAVLYNFSNKCESLLLRMKIENYIESALMEQKE